MKTLAFTGTRAGLTPEQTQVLYEIFENAKKTGYNTLLNGCAVGADQDVVVILNTLNGFHLIGYPSNLIQQQSKYALDCCELAYKPADPLKRNHKMVDAADYLIAAPKQYTEPGATRCGGTWATIRYARKMKKTVIIVWPNGIIKVDHD